MLGIRILDTEACTARTCPLALEVWGQLLGFVLPCSPGACPVSSSNPRVPWKWVQLGFLEQKESGHSKQQPCPGCGPGAEQLEFLRCGPAGAHTLEAMYVAAWGPFLQAEPHLFMPCHGVAKKVGSVGAKSKEGQGGQLEGRCRDCPVPALGPSLLS